MAKKAELVQLETSDDATSVRDRLTTFKGQRVLLVWPESGQVLSRRLDLVLVQREAMRRAIQLGLVTHSPQVIEFAAELNISTFETIGASERKRWKRGRAKVFTDRSKRPEDEPDVDDLIDVASRIRIEEAPGVRLRRAITRILVLGLLLGITLGLGFVVLPSATVTLTPARDQVQIVVEILADPQATDVDVESNTIPATILRIEVEDAGTIPTTGAQDVADIPATGSVIFINQTNRSIEIPAGTTVSTSAGTTPIMFRTTQDTTVAGGVGNQLETAVEALQSSAGSVGNLESGLINTVIGPLADSLTVRNLSPTFGGESRSLAAVSQADRDRLLATVRQQIQARAFTEISPRLEESQFIIIETLRIAEERSDLTNFSAAVGDAAETLSLSMRVVVEATAVNEQFGQQVTFAHLASQIPRGRVIQPASIVYERGSVQQTLPDGRVVFTMMGTGTVIQEIDANSLAERLARRTVEEAMQYLLTEVALDEGTTPHIEITPALIERMPVLPLRIKIVLQEAAS